MTPEEFRKYGHQLIDWVADYRTRIADLPVMAQTKPGEIRAKLPSKPPDAPESFAEIFKDLDRIIMPGLSHWQHPRFFGYFPSNGSLASVLGDYLSTGLGVLGLSWQSSPALTEVEEVATDWMRQMLGLSDAWSGVIQDTASTSTLIALICARERATNYSLSGGGLQSEAQPLTVYVSTHSHSSVEKAALLAGFGRKNVRVVPHDAEYAMRPARACRNDSQGRRGGHEAMRGSRDHGHNDHHRVRSRRRNRRCCPCAQSVAACGCRDGGLRDDPAGVPCPMARESKPPIRSF